MKVSGDSPVNYPAFWFDPAEHPGEPAFVVVHEDSSVALVTLGWVREQGYTWLTEGIAPTWTYMAIRKPGEDTLWRCVMQLLPSPQAGGGTPMLRFLNDGGDYTVEL